MIMPSVSQSGGDNGDVFVVVPLPNDHVDIDRYYMDWRWARMSSSSVHEEPIIVVDQRTTMSFSPSDLVQLMSADVRLANQFQRFRSFFTSPVCLARNTSVVTDGTYWGYVKTLREFFGYLSKNEGLRVFDLRLCFDGPKLLRYVSYRMGVQGNKPSTILNQLFHLKAAQRWCLAERSVDDLKTAEEFYRGMEALCRQLKETNPITHDPMVHYLQDAGKWVEWPQLHSYVDTYATTVLADVRAFRDRRGEGESIPIATAEAIELAVRLNTSLFGMIWGGGINIGPPRPFLMKSLVLKGGNLCGGLEVEEEGDAHCNVCAHPACRGNRLEKANNGDFVLSITHHKTGNKIKKAIPPIFIRKATDATAWAVVEEVFQWGHAALVGSYDASHTMSPNERMRLFRKSETGEVFRVSDPQENGPTMYVIKLMAELCGASSRDLHITANTLRRMYISWANNNLTADEQEGAALAMGTSVAMFKQVYDPTRRLSIIERAQSGTRKQLIKGRATAGAPINSITTHHQAEVCDMLLSINVK